MIEARGGKDAYVYQLAAVRTNGGHVHIKHSMMFDVADSEDEAYGRAMRAAEAAYPKTNGWRDHFVQPKAISGIAWIGRHDLSKITPAD